MRLSEIFDQLTHGELTSLNIGGVDNVGIQTLDYPKVLPHINLALTQLHARFPIKLGEAIIKLYDHIETYHLHPDYAQSNSDISDKPTLYIDDSIYEPFYDEVVKIERIMNEDGQELFVNDETEYWSVHTIGQNTIQIPYPDKENSLDVVYRANHRQIGLTNRVWTPTTYLPGTGGVDVPGAWNDVALDPEAYEVELPYIYLEPLLFYVGSRALASLNSDQNQEGNNYLQKYEASCQRIEALGLTNRSNRTNQKLEQGGWV